MTNELKGAGGSEPTPWRVGENVPWTAPWTAETEFRLQPSVNFPGRVEVVQRSAQGEGQPVLDGMHVMRQRAGVVHHLCHVCGSATPPDDRVIFPASTGLFVTHRDGSRRYANQTPPIHRACAERARKLCPHLRTTLSEPVALPDEESEVMCETNPPPAMVKLARSLPPGVKPVFSYFRVFSREFSIEVEALRERSGPLGMPAR